MEINQINGENTAPADNIYNVEEMVFNQGKGGYRHANQQQK